MEFRKVRKKPVKVEAFQLTKEMLCFKEEQKDIFVTNYRRIIAIRNSSEGPQWTNKFIVETLEGDMIAKVGDWIIKGVKGEIYPCREDIFKETYEVL